MNKKTKKDIERKLVKDFIDYFVNEEGMIDKDDIIYAVADDLANEYSYENDFDRYQGVNRYDKIYDKYFNHYSKIAKKILNGK